MYGIIYKVTNTINNKVYVGQTTRSLSRRRIEHINQAKNNGKSCRYFHNAILKYGIENFKWEVIYKATNKEELNKKEIEFISQFNSYGENGYNLCCGGDSNAGYKLKYKRVVTKGWTLLRKQNQSKKMLGTKVSEETKEKLRQYNLGKKASEETRLKMSISGKGKGVKPILCKNNGIIYNSLTEAAEKLNLRISDISVVASGKQKYTKGYIFEYVKKITNTIPEVQYQ